MSACDVPPMFIVPTPPPSSKLGIALRRGAGFRFAVPRPRARPPRPGRAPPASEHRAPPLRVTKNVDTWSERTTGIRARENSLNACKPEHTHLWGGPLPLYRLLPEALDAEARTSRRCHERVDGLRRVLQAGGQQHYRRRLCESS